MGSTFTGSKAVFTFLAVPAGLLQLHFNDGDRLVAGDFRSVHSTRRAPFHVTRFEFQYRCFATLWSDLLAAARQVDHHAVDLVFVRLSLGVRLGHYLEHASLVIIDRDLPVLAREAGCRRQEQRGEMRCVSHWSIIQRDFASFLLPPRTFENSPASC